ncbi:MAG: alkaline phytoceramidase [Acidobacteria bacterium]|nr:alkaline phytoceramidase [Acidobacteriota bacterium]
MDAAGYRLRVALIAGLPVVALAFLFFHGRMAQNEVLPNYHNFADQRALWGLPNFWNVVSNLPFLLVALWGLRALGSRSAFVEKWERTACFILLIAVALTCVGSSYYHAWPGDASLFWDRLPMAAVFMALLATTVGERISPRGGRLLLFPLLAAGVASVLYWRVADDLRLYALVHFYAVGALPLILILFPPRYSGSAGIVAMIALYGLALALDRFDHQVAAITVTGGHPWKHVAAAAAMCSYLSTIAHRHPLPRRQVH